MVGALFRWKHTKEANVSQIDDCRRRVRSIALARRYRTWLIEGFQPLEDPVFGVFLLYA